MTPLRVIIETPYASPIPGVVAVHVEYARACMFDSLHRGEAPILSHLLYTQVLQDADPLQRAKGITSGYAWMRVAECVVAYVDLGISGGMAAALSLAKHKGIKTMERTLPENMGATFRAAVEHARLDVEKAPVAQ